MPALNFEARFSYGGPCCEMLQALGVSCLTVWDLSAGIFAASSARLHCSGVESAMFALGCLLFLLPVGTAQLADKTTFLECAAAYACFRFVVDSCVLIGAWSVPGLNASCEQKLDGLANVTSLGQAQSLCAKVGPASFVSFYVWNDRLNRARILLGIPRESTRIYVQEVHPVFRSRLQFLRGFGSIWPSSRLGQQLSQSWWVSDQI